MFKDTITFFNISDKDSQQLKTYVAKLKDNFDNYDKRKNYSKEIQQFIDNLLSKANVSGESKLNEEIECIGSGSTSVCFRTCNNAEIKKVIKVFAPHAAISESIRCIKGKKTVGETSVNTRYCWIGDDASINDTESFLRRFVRFIDQKEEINIYMESANKNEENAFFNPELKLSSKGLAYVDTSFYGSTLQEEFDKIYRHSLIHGTDKDNILNIIKFVRESARNVFDFCHKNATEKIFHGDIKPSNFFKITTNKGKGEYCIRPIDFDTWTSETKKSNGYLKAFSASTPLFYSKVNVEQSIDELIEHDVLALAYMLMYGLSLAVGVDPREEYDRLTRSFDWWEYFFCEPNRPAENLFNILNYNEKGSTKRDNLGGVYIFELLRDILTRVVNCDSDSDTAIKQLNDEQNSAETFIGYLTSIENLLKADLSGNTPDDIDDRAIRYSGLSQIKCADGDERLQYNYYSSHMLKSFVSQALEGYFSKKDMK